jgi:hypothetical protein
MALGVVSLWGAAPAVAFLISSDCIASHTCNCSCPRRRPVKEQELRPRLLCHRLRMDSAWVRPEPWLLSWVLADLPWWRLIREHKASELDGWLGHKSVPRLGRVTRKIFPWQLYRVIFGNGTIWNPTSVLWTLHVVPGEEVESGRGQMTICTRRPSSTVNYCGACSGRPFCRASGCHRCRHARSPIAS